MPYINISEIDNTQYGLSQVTNNNIVYCPINSICGTYEPTLIGSYDDFVAEYGTSGCIGDPSYTYAKDILLAGFPILCKRIRYMDAEPGDQEHPSDINTGKASFVQSSDSTAIYAKYHGTYMNGVVPYIEVTSRSYTFSDGTATIGDTMIVTIKRGSNIIESAAIYCSLDLNSLLASSAPQQIARDLLDQLNNYEFNYVKFNFGTTSGNSRLVAGYKFNANGANKLSGGLDLSNANNSVGNFLLGAYRSTQSDDPDSPRNMYLDFLVDKYMWDVKFITTGGYTYDASASQTAHVANQTATFKAMISLCEARQDCFALLDIPYGILQSNVKSEFSDIDTTYAAAYAPWTYNKLMDGTKQWMPPSFTFLTNLAASVSSGTPIYYPPAGVNRMTCRRTIKAEYEIGKKILDQWQTNDSWCINPIMRIRGSGYVVYGQRTLVNLISPVIATSLKSVTVRFCSIEIKKAIFNACIQLTFEQNILRTWNEFKSRVETTLMDMKKNGGLNSYMIIMDRSTISNSDLNNNIARGIVRAAINDALENFEISFEISPSYVNFDEEEDTINASIADEGYKYQNY